MMLTYLLLYLKASFLTSYRYVKWVVSERLIYEGVGTYWAPRGFLLGVEAVYKVNRYGLY